MSLIELILQWSAFSKYLYTLWYFCKLLCIHHNDCYGNRISKYRLEKNYCGFQVVDKIEISDIYLSIVIFLIALVRLYVHPGVWLRKQTWAASHLRLQCRHTSPDALTHSPWSERHPARFRWPTCWQIKSPHVTILSFNGIQSGPFVTSRPICMKRCQMSTYLWQDVIDTCVHARARARVRVRQCHVITIACITEEGWEFSHMPHITLPS